MQSFTLEKPLPSTYVTRDLVRSVESYIASRVEALLATSEDAEAAIAAARKTTITDTLGTETVPSIDDFAPSRFPDTTTRVGIEFRGPTRSSVDTLVVDLQFDESRTASRARISYTGANARALVTGFFEGVSACIATHPARKWMDSPRIILGRCHRGAHICSLLGSNVVLDEGNSADCLVGLCCLALDVYLYLRCSSLQAVHSVRV